MQQRQHARISRLRRIASIGSICLVLLCACGGGDGVNTPAPIAPSITVQPTSLSVRAGQPATFSVTADGDAPLSYQWQRNGVNVAEATAASYTLAGTLMADSGSTWTVKISNATASITSTPATLTVTAPAVTPVPIAPGITVQPTSLSVRAGQPATFSVAADGDAPLSYQWQRNGVNVAEATAASYTLVGTLMADSGSTWTVSVSNATASVTSTPATLTVTAQAGTISLVATNVRGYQPNYLAVDGKGNLYVYSELFPSSTLLKITPAGVTSVLASNLASKFKVMGLTVDADGTVYLLELDYSRVFFGFPSSPSSWGAFVRKISPEGVVTTIADAGTDNPQDLSLDAAGNLYWHSNINMHAILSVSKCTPTGVITTIAVGSGDLAHQTMDKFGNLYGTNTYYGNDLVPKGSIIKVSPDGKFSTLAGSTVATGTADGSGTNARFGQLSGLALDSAGNVYVADSSNNTIRKISPGGFVSTVAGKAGSDGIVLGALPGGLSKLSSLVMGADGLLYVYSNNTILKIQFAD